MVAGGVVFPTKKQFAGLHDSIEANMGNGPSWEDCLVAPVFGCRVCLSSCKGKNMFVRMGFRLQGAQKQELVADVLGRLLTAVQPCVGQGEGCASMGK